MLDLYNKKVIVTGPKSMVGRCVCDRLINLNAVVEPIYHEDTNLLDLNQTFKRFENFKADYVVHLAGWNGGIELNRLMPSTIFFRTTQMALNIIQACCHFNVKKMVGIISSCAYPDLGEESLKEIDFLNGAIHTSVECHGYAKRNLFIASELAAKEHNIIAVNCVVNNMYGPFDSFSLTKTKVVGALIKKFVDARNKNEPTVTLFGTGKPRRELIYCADGAEGVIQTLLHYNNSFEPINIGTGVDISIKDLAEKIAGLVNFKGKIEWDTSKADGQMRKLLDNTKMKEILKWEPKTSLDEGLAKTIEFYEQNILLNKSER